MPPSERVASGLLDGVVGSALATGEFQRRPNSASKKFWAEAEALEMTSVVAVMPVTKIPLTPRLKRVWRRINKAKDSPPSRADGSPYALALTNFSSGRKYDLRVLGLRSLPVLVASIASSK